MLLTLSDGLEEGCEDEAEVVTWVEAMPECTGGERCETGAETGFLAFRCDAQVHVVS